jgi:enoyl-[acyl-carrier protein] reductase III
MPNTSRWILITGGTRGLGLAIARAFAEQARCGFILGYRSDEQAARAASDELRSSGSECHPIALDLAEPDAGDRLFAKVRELTPRLDVYVHNAAATAFKPLMDLGPHHVQKTFQITVGSFIRNVQLAVPMMPAGGAVVAISGMDTKEAVPFHGLLGAAKAALETLTAYWAHELAGRGIQVNAINPGYLETDSTKKYFGPLFDRANAAFAGMTPSGKAARLEDVAAAVRFLASPEARWIVGQTVLADGGQTFASPATPLFRQIQGKANP